MKTLFRNIAILTILLTTMTSCDDVKDLLDFETDVVLTEYFTVSIDSGGEYTDTKDISILTKAVEPYKDKLKKVKIQKITFQIIDYNGEDNAEYDVKFTADGTTFITENFVADANGALFEVTDSDGLNSLATKLLNNDSVTISLNASTTMEAAAYFRVETKFYIDVTANPL